MDLTSCDRCGKTIAAGRRRCQRCVAETRCPECVVEIQDGAARIRFCRLHEAAPDLLLAVAETMAALRAYYTRNVELTEARANALVDQMDAAIEKAGGCSAAPSSS